jgi:peptidoglycan/LPS O-acetylase OafA/YrhL
MVPDTSRMSLLDALKAIACLTIVAHHLAAYGPMSEIAYPLFPRLLDEVYEHGRIAVQVFFVVAGFLFAGKHAPGGSLLVTDPVHIIKQRYFRLVIPYIAALILAIGCAAIARCWMVHESIPGAAGFFQILAHALLLQDLLDQEALSAGVWYVAIDFQLFALSVILFWISRRIHAQYPAMKSIGMILITSLTLASLFIFNRHTSLDETAFYFFGSLGLGIIIYWISNRQRNSRYPALWLLLPVLVVIAALLVDFRSRIAVAGAVMLILGLARYYGSILENLPMPYFLTYLGRISYSIFLVHFPLCMAVNATFFHFFPDQPVTNACGLILALGVSILGGAIFFRWIENNGNGLIHGWGKTRDAVASATKNPRFRA